MLEQLATVSLLPDQSGLPVSPLKRADETDGQRIQRLLTSGTPKECLTEATHLHARSALLTDSDLDGAMALIDDALALSNRAAQGLRATLQK